MSDDADELRAEIALLRHEISILRAELARQRLEIEDVDHAVGQGMQTGNLTSGPGNSQADNGDL